MTQHDDAAPGRPRRRAERLLGAPAEAPAAAPARTRVEAPRAVRWAALVVAVEALAFLAGAVAMVVSAVTGSAASQGNALALAVLLLVLGGLLGAVARGVWRVATWARSPVVALQIMLGLMGITAISEAHAPAFGVPALALVALEFYFLATPEARLAFFRRPGA